MLEINMNISQKLCIVRKNDDRPWSCIRIIVWHYCPIWEKSRIIWEKIFIIIIQVFFVDWLRISKKDPSKFPPCYHKLNIAPERYDYLLLSRLNDYTSIRIERDNNNFNRKERANLPTVANMTCIRYVIHIQIRYTYFSRRNKRSTPANRTIK